MLSFGFPDGKDPCETAYLTMKCFFETLPEVIIALQKYSLLNI